MKDDFISTALSRDNALFLKDDFLFEKKTFISTMTEAHYHGHYEIYYLLSGSQNYFINGKYYGVNKGDVVLVPKWVMHKTASGYGGYRFLINFNDNFLSKYYSKTASNALLDVFSQPIVRPAEEKAGEVLNLFNAIGNDAKDLNNPSLFLNFTALLLLLKNCKSIKEENVSRELQTLGYITDFLDKNFANVNSLQDVSNALYVSKYHVCHLFARHLGTTFSGYLTKLRLKNATEMLISSTKTVSFVAESCGFNTTTYFCNVFKKEYGCSPLKYKNAFSKNQTK